MIYSIRLDDLKRDISHELDPFTIRDPPSIRTPSGVEFLENSGARVAVFATDNDNNLDYGPNQWRAGAPIGQEIAQYLNGLINKLVYAKQLDVLEKLEALLGGKVFTGSKSEPIVRVN